jgi:hypothetical protein
MKNWSIVAGFQVAMTLIALLVAAVYANDIPRDAENLKLMDLPNDIFIQQIVCNTHVPFREQTKMIHALGSVSRSMCDPARRMLEYGQRQWVARFPDPQVAWYRAALNVFTKRKEQILRDQLNEKILRDQLNDRLMMQVRREELPPKPDHPREGSFLGRLRFPWPKKLLGREVNRKPLATTILESTPLESTPLESTPLEHTPLERKPLESKPLTSPFLAQLQFIVEQGVRQTKNGLKVIQLQRLLVIACFVNWTEAATLLRNQLGPSQLGGAESMCTPSHEHNIEAYKQYVAERMHQFALANAQNTKQTEKMIRESVILDNSMQDAAHETMLSWTIRHNRPDLAKVLLEEGVDPNVPLLDMTPLHLATIIQAGNSENPENILLLLKAGADPRAVCNHGMTAVATAASRSQGGAMILRALFTDPRSTETLALNRGVYEFTPLHFGIVSKDPDTVRVLLEEYLRTGTDINSSLLPGDRGTLLALALEMNSENADIARTLRAAVQQVEYGGNIRARTRFYNVAETL